MDPVAKALTGPSVLAPLLIGVTGKLDLELSLIHI